MEKAKAAVFTGAKSPFKITEYEITKPKAGMASLELIASGVCGTDLHIYNGKIALDPPKIIGHEFVGRVKDISPEDSAKCGIKVGDNAIIDIACPCGHCELCEDGDDANCINLGVTNGLNPEDSPHFHGGYAQMSYAPIANLIKLPEGVDPLAACVFACPGPTAIHSFRLANRAGWDMAKTKLAVVQGIGPVACMAVAWLARAGVEHVIALCTNSNQQKHDMVKALGASDVWNIKQVSDDEIIARINKLSGGLGADLVFEGSGNPEAVPLGLQLLRNRGLYLVPGQYSNSGGISIQPQLITLKALQIIGSSQYSVCDVEDYVAFLKADGAFQQKIKRLATCYHVEDVNTAFEDAIARKNIKTVLIP